MGLFSKELNRLQFRALIRFPNTKHLIYLWKMFWLTQQMKKILLFVIDFHCIGFRGINWFEIEFRIKMWTNSQIFSPNSLRTTTKWIQKTFCLFRRSEHQMNGFNRNFIDWEDLMRNCVYKRTKERDSSVKDSKFLNWFLITFFKTHWKVIF